MIQTGFESRVKIQQIIDNQLPEFILEESPKSVEFLKQYYISQEFKSGPVDISENLDQYLKLENLTPEVIVGFTSLSTDISVVDEEIYVSSTKGFPTKYGLFKINDEIITYTGITTNSFTGCIRGFSGITDYHKDLKLEELVFSESSASFHTSGSQVKNLSSLFLQEFYKKLKFSLTPGLENIDFVSNLNVGNFIKESRSLYESKGTSESFRILFNILYGESPTIIDLEEFLIRPSNSEYVRREVIVVEALSGNPILLEGQTIFKSTDIQTSASVSEVETINRSGKIFYKLFLFLGYDDTYPTITGTFNITPSTKNLDKVSVGSSVISVDSTIGFSESGNIYFGNNKIFYSHKSVNQFFGCSAVNIEIPIGSIIRSDQTYYGYENGDVSRKVEFRITGVLSDIELEVQDNNLNFIEGDQINPLTIGEKIKNPDFNKTIKQIFANSWVYNTKTRYQIESFSGNTITLKNKVDKSNIKNGDIIEVLYRNTNEVVDGYENILVNSVNNEDNEESLKNRILTTNESFSSLISTNNTNFDVRRKIKKANSSIVPIEFGNDTIISDVLNVYDENSEYLYVASNSLPSYLINSNIFKYTISRVDTNSYDPETEGYSILEFNSEVSFITGDKIYYDYTNLPISGLEKGSYFVEVLPENKKIRLYSSSPTIGSNSFVTYAGFIPEGTHTITLFSQKNNKISPQKLFKKFKLNPNIGSNRTNYTIPGPIGMLKNGVEIYNYKSNDKIYYGPLKSVDVLNGGFGYDVINPPSIEINFGGALLQPVVSGSVEKIYVDPQDFNIDEIISINLIGGNGNGALFSPIIEKKRRELEFDARPIQDGGQLDYNDETISFSSPHNLINGQQLRYNNNNSQEIGIGSFYGSNSNQNETLKNKSFYYVKLINERTIQLYSNFSDYNSGINTIGFTTIGNKGIHKFETDTKNVLTEIKVINGGSGYTNRLLRINSSGISTFNHTFNFDNHGFNDGELVVYSPDNFFSSRNPIPSGWFAVNLINNPQHLPNAWSDLMNKYAVYPSDTLALEDTNHTTNWNITVLKEGNYTLRLQADNSSTLSIDGVQVASSGNYSPGGETQVSIFLNVGNHQISCVVYNLPVGTSNWNSNPAGIAWTLEYEPQSVISELSTTNQYYILKVDSNSFRICDAGIGGTNTSNYERKNYVKFTNKGSGYQTFNYPKISLDLKYTLVGLGSTQIFNNINVTPVIRGKVDQVYVYEKGSDYGTNILNVHQRPPTTVKIGSSAQFLPIISDGKIIKVKVQYGGVDYYSMPDLIVSGDGIGALLRPVLFDNKIVDVIVINSGYGYSQGSTTIQVQSTGKNLLLQTNVRSLTLNNSYKYGTQTQFFRDPSSEVFIETNNNLQYSVLSYSNYVKNNIGDDGILELNESGRIINSKHSSIIGWAYDGNPIYGPYGYSDPNDTNSPIKQLVSSYSIKSIENRPNVNDSIFIEDFQYDGSGDLDECNGRFTKTPEFPNGVYAYFTTISKNLQGKIIGKFPYFIGNTYRSDILNENLFLNQSFDFNNSTLSRNTLPYAANEPFADYDFVFESNEIIDQKTLIESVTSGSVTDLKIIDSGSNYSVGDKLIFNDSGTAGGGILAQISEIKGREIVDVKTSITSYSNSVIEWESPEKVKVCITPYHELSNNDGIIISGLTSQSNTLNGFYQIGIATHIAGVANTIPNYSSTGIVTDIYLTNIPSNISIGSSIKIDNEIFSVLNNYSNFGILRVSRSSTGTSHSTSTPVYFLPDYFTINKKIDYFNSKPNNKFYFNPTQSIGVGTTPGSGVYKNYNIGITTYSVFIPTQSIFIPNHTFNTGEEVILRKVNGNSISVSNFSSGALSFNILSGSSEKVYVIKKSKDFIGIVTNVGLTTSSNGVFFFSSGSDDYFYSVESNYNQIFADISRINGIISLSTSHNLKYGDLVSLRIEPNISVGIGTSTSVDVKIDEITQSLIINPLVFSSSGINTSFNYVTIPHHNLQNGDKVVYKSTGSVASGLTQGIYYVYKIDDDRISLCETFKDSLSIPPLIVNIDSIGSGNHSINLINPQIPIIKNNNLVFNLSDSSLQGYDFKIYYDKNFTKEFISDGSESNFSIIGIGTVGVSSTASLTINFSEKSPEKLYYSLEKSGYISTSDKEVINYSQILLKNSKYNGEYYVNGIGSTTYTISLKSIPEKLSYDQNECDTLEYTTKSSAEVGGASKLQLLSGGVSYKNLPLFESTDSKNGSGLFVKSLSNQIGNIKQEKVINEGFEYSSDKTLRPTAFIPKSLSISSANTIDSISIVNGGKDYTLPPNLVCIDTDTGKLIDSGYIRATLFGSSINSVIIENNPKGLPSKPVTIRAVDNSNGISINRVEYSSSGTVSCTLVTPIFGFTNPPFSENEKIYVEGIQKIDSNGNGFNSSDNGYNFFTVTKYISSNPAILEYDISEFTRNPGTPKPIQESYASIISYSNYPEFRVTQTFSPFFIGEKLYTYNDNEFIDTDLVVINSDSNSLRVFGEYDLSPNEKVRGNQSLSEAIVKEQYSVKGKYNIKYSNKKDLGWKKNDGKLNEDFQVISDNDYYQNLSYSIKSNKTWNEIVTPVNNLLHPSGMKNFADFQIEKSVTSGIETSTTSISITNYFVSENRVDRINNFDLVRDIDILNPNTTQASSKFLEFNKVKLSNYVLCKTNRVLELDDISRFFSNSEDDRSSTTNISDINPSNQYNKFLVQIRNIDTEEIQFDEVITINNDNNIFTLNKGFVSSRTSEYFTFNNNFLLSKIDGYINDLGIFYLRFIPYDEYDSIFDIKVLQTTISNDIGISSTKQIGCVDLINENKNFLDGITDSLISIDSSKYSSLHANIVVSDLVGSEINYVELYLTHDGTNSYLSEYYFDNKIGNSSEFIGTFSSSISNGILSLNYTNNSNKTIKVRTNSIGFGSTDLGEDVYRFINVGEIPGNERSVLYSTNYTNVSSASTTILTLDKTLFLSVKSTIKVSVGNKSALHQILSINDSIDSSFLVQYPFLSDGDTTGIGTFGSEIVNDNFNIKFYPDSSVTGNIEIISFSECFYKELDFSNDFPSLNYGKVTSSLGTYNYFGLNLFLGERTDFQLRYNSTPVFSKRFNPLSSSTVEYSTGRFNIPNHFFSTGEELIYTPGSTFSGVPPISMGIGETSNYLGVVTNILPNKLWAIKDNNSVFRVATRPEYAFQGISVTFTSPGSGNAHRMEMYKKNEKVVISINNLVQYPVSYSLINHNLPETITGLSTIFKLSGIGSIFVDDILKIDNEYMKVENVGFGTTTESISFNGDLPLVQVVRGSLGTKAEEHSGSSVVGIYRGFYNIVGDRIFFTEPPKGSLLDSIEPLPTVLPRQRDTFNGRVFLRKNYETSRIYDDISDKFTGIDQTFTLTTQGINTTGIGTSGGNGIVFINNIFQSPTTLNNLGNNYFITENSGISSIVFTGITSADGTVYKSIFDVNQNQLPRGGLIVSLGSTPGLGYAPLVGASVTATVDSNGSILSVGIGSTIGTFGSGYRNPVSVAVTESFHTGIGATIEAIVGAGGTLSFNIIGGGTGYINPTINISPPSYENLPVIGVSRLGIGETTDTGTGLLLNVQVSASSTSVGIGSTLFEVSSFKITRPGYGFKKGDVFTPVGLVTSKGFDSPPELFKITVLEVFNDSFGAWQFGELDYIDSIKPYQDGVRTRFPIFYEGKLLSFEIDENDPDSQLIEFAPLFLIFVNGVLQKSGESYDYTGGTAFTFKVPPKPTDNISIFFYRGSRGEDTEEVTNVRQTVKKGDNLQVFSNNNFLDLTVSDNVPRTVYEIAGSSKVETNIYKEVGIDELNLKPVFWSKQKSDLVINGEFVSKIREILEPQIYPTARVISGISTNSTDLFLDSIKLFNYENERINAINFDAIIMNQESNPIMANINSTVSASGTISSLNILDGGEGYASFGSTISLIISSPNGSLIETINNSRATAYATVSNTGIITYPIVITNPGFGYTYTSPPQVITELKPFKTEVIKNISILQGSESSIVGISTTTGIGVPLAFRFELFPAPTLLSNGYLVYISNTNVGNGVTSINTGNNDIVSISTSFLDNIYYVSSYSSSTGILTCNVHSETVTIGIQTIGTADYPVGKLSWGRISNFTRSNNPISIGVSGYTSSVGITSFGYNSGLSTYPIIQRRGVGFNKTGSLDLRILDQDEFL